jgi:predicted Zn-dependent peptidase
VDQKTLDRARVKLRSSLYDTMGQFGGFGLMDLLASFALFDDDPARVNSLVGEFQKVTPQQVQKTAQEYLRSTNRTIVSLEPAPKEAAAAPAKNQ